MNNVPPNKTLLFKYEVLRARIDIRNFFLEYVVREVYENIGQILSSARMQLGILEIEGTLKLDEAVSSPGSLVGQSIRDLRSLSRSFYPDVQILTEEGFIEGLHNMISILWPQLKNTVEIRGIRKDIQYGLILIIFKMIKEILSLIKELQSQLFEMLMLYSSEKIKFVIGYSGNEIWLDGAKLADATNHELSLTERAKLIKGRLRTTKSKSGINRIILISPYKSALHE